MTASYYRQIFPPKWESTERAAYTRAIRRKSVKHAKDSEVRKAEKEALKVVRHRWILSPSKHHKARVPVKNKRTFFTRLKDFFSWSARLKK